MKTALNQHLLRSDSTAPTYTEVKTSQQIVDFGNKHLSKPRSTAGLKEQVFSELLPATVLRRKELDSEDPTDSKTLHGIKSVFEIICQVSGGLRDCHHSSILYPGRWYSALAALPLLLSPMHGQPVAFMPTD